MNKKKFHLTIGFIIIICSLYYAFKDISVSETIAALSSVRLIYMVPAFFAVALSFLFRAIRWHFFIAPIKKVKTAKLFSPLIVGFMSNMLPARAGEFIRAYLLSKKENISYSASFATIFIERLFDLLFVLLLLLYVLIFREEIFAFVNPGAGNNIIDYMIKFGWISFIGCLLIFIFSVFLQYRNELVMKTVCFFIKPLPAKWEEKVIQLVNSFAEGLRIIKDKRRLAAALMFSFLINVAIIFVFYLLYLAFDIDYDLPLLSSLIVLCLTIDIFVALFPTPGFIGSFHAACIAALHGVFGVPKAVALSYGVVAWLVLMGFTIVVGVVFAIHDNISLGELSERMG